MKKATAPGKRASGASKPTGATAPPADPPRGLDAAAWRRLAESVGRPPEPECPFRVAEHPPAATPAQKSHRMAMDNNTNWAAGAWATAGWLNGIAAEGLTFLGYPYLSELAQRPEYRVISEIRATEMTRKWIRFRGVGDDNAAPGDLEDPPSIGDGMPGIPPGTPSVGHNGGPSLERLEREDRIAEIEERMTELAVRDHFAALALNDGLFGRGHLFHEIGGVDEGPELATAIGDGRNFLTQSKVNQKTPLTRLQSIEPVWVYPTTYNATNPLKENWYRPDVWYAMGVQIHRSRLTTLIGRPVPDLLKPAYSFGGLSLSQLAKPYVDIWLRTRQSVADLIHSFSVMVLKTDLDTILQSGSASGIQDRANAFNLLRDNRGLFILNKASEDFTNVSASLAGLHELQAQAQEHIASCSRLPLVKFTGISPSGLNASSDGEIRVFYDTINADQESLFRAPLTFTINLIQLSLFGEVDPSIRFDFAPLWAMTEKEEAEVREIEMRTDSAAIDAGVLHPAESRARLAADPGSKYDSLDPDDVPELLQEEEGGLEPHAGAAKIAEAGMMGGVPGESPGQAHDPEHDPEHDVEADHDPFALDEASFEEAKHPRDKGGKFATSGSGGSFGGESGKSPKAASGSKKAIVGELLKKEGGATTAEILKATGWPSISMPAAAKSLGVELVKTKENGVIKYKSKPIGEKSADLDDVDMSPEFTAALNKLTQGHAALKAEVDKIKENKESPIPAPEATVTTQSAKGVVGGMLVGKGFFPEDVTSGGNQVFKKGDAKIKVMPDGKWLSINPGNLPKEGAGAESLEKLITGNGISPGVVNKHGATIENWPEGAVQVAPKKTESITEFNYHAKMSELASKLPPPTPAQKSAVGTYTGSSYTSINDNLRHGKGGLDKPPPSHIQAYLDKAEIAEDITVYRRVSGDYSKILKSIAIEGMEFRDKGFMSTSLHPGKWHGDLTMEIAVKKGARGAPISQWSHSPGEIEVLFRAGTRLRVKSFDETAGRMKVEMVDG